MSPETILKKGDKVRFVTYEEAVAVCGYPHEKYGVECFSFPETGTNPAIGEPYTLTLTEEFVRKNGGTVVTISDQYTRYGGSHIHYRIEQQGGIDEKYAAWTFCPTMFSGYEDDEPIDRTYAEDLFGFLFQ